MKIVVDENIPRPTVHWLIAENHAVIDLRGTPGRARKTQLFGALRGEKPRF